MPPVKPNSIAKFDYLFLGALILDLMAVIAGWDWIAEVAQAELASASGDTDAEAFVSNTMFIFMVVRFGLLFGIWMLISIFRSGYLRYALAIWLALSAISLIADLMNPTLGTFFNIASVAILVMNVAALYFVFKPESGEWLRRGF